MWVLSYTGRDSLFQLGAFDSGAHVTQKCGTGESTCVLTNFVRDDGIWSLEEGVYQLTVATSNKLNPHTSAIVTILALQENANPPIWLLS